MLSQQRNPRTDCKSAQQCTTRGHPIPLPFPQVTFGSVQYYRHAATDRQRDTQTRVTTIHFASSIRLTQNVINHCSVLYQLRVDVWQVNSNVHVLSSQSIARTRYLPFQHYFTECRPTNGGFYVDNLPFLVVSNSNQKRSFCPVSLHVTYFLL